MQVSRADYVRDTFGNSGSGVKIGMIEAEGVPDTENAYLSGASITCRPGDTTVVDHATLVALIMVEKIMKVMSMDMLLMHPCIAVWFTIILAGRSKIFMQVLNG